VPSIGHIAVGLAAARMAPPPRGVSTRAWQWSLAALALVPDLDVVAFRLGIPYAAPFGHRGAAHSLAMAALAGIAGAVVGGGRRLSPLRIGVLAAAVVATHGLLDTMTDGGRGVALLWPVSNARFFAPWRPIPVAPIGTGMLSRRGAEVVLTELLLFLPVFAIGLWPRKTETPAPDPEA
jgi:inner membrane protein